METIEKSNDLDNLEEDLRIFRKNETAVYDMISLYEFLSSNKDSYNLIEITLVEKVIKDLEDHDVIIPYKAESILELLII